MNDNQEQPGDSSAPVWINRMIAQALDPESAINDQIEAETVRVLECLGLQAAETDTQKTLVGLFRKLINQKHLARQMATGARKQFERDRDEMGRLFSSVPAQVVSDELKARSERIFKECETTTRILESIAASVARQLEDAITAALGE